MTTTMHAPVVATARGCGPRDPGGGRLRLARRRVLEAVVLADVGLGLSVVCAGL